MTGSCDPLRSNRRSDPGKPSPFMLVSPAPWFLHGARLRTDDGSPHIESQWLEITIRLPRSSTLERLVSRATIERSCAIGDCPPARLAILEGQWPERPVSPLARLRCHPCPRSLFLMG